MTEPALSPILLVDCSYLAFLLESRNSAKQSKIYNKLDSTLLKNLTDPPIHCSITDKQNVYNVRDIILTLITNLIRMVSPDNIILVFGSSENLLENEYSEAIVRAILKPLDLDQIVLKNEKYSDFIFSFLQKYSPQLKDRLLVYATNSLNVWACCSHTLQHACACFTKNMRPIFILERLDWTFSLSSLTQVRL